MTPITTNSITAPSQTSTGGRERIQRFTGMLHTAIDKVDQGLGARSAAVSPTLRAQISDRPLRSAGIAVGAFVILRKMLRRAPNVQTHVIQVPVPARSFYDPPVTRRASTTAGHMSGKTQGVLSKLPLQLRRATDGLRLKGREYGTRAHYGVRSHPVAGLGTVAGAGALLTLWLSRRNKAKYEPAYVAADGQADGFFQSGARGMIASRPVASAAVILGVGAMMGAMLRRQ